MAKILLVDGNSLTYRAFFALPPDMATASGQVTNAVFGFTSMLISIEVKPNTALVTCPDAVARSVGRAKKARYVRELPSMRRTVRGTTPQARGHPR